MAFLLWALLVMVSIMDVDEPVMMLIHQFAFEVLVAQYRLFVAVVLLIVLAIRSATESGKRPMQWMVRVLTPFGVIEFFHQEIWGPHPHACLGWSCHQGNSSNCREKFHVVHPMDWSGQALSKLDGAQQVFSSDQFCGYGSNEAMGCSWPSTLPWPLPSLVMRSFGAWSVVAVMDVSDWDLFGLDLPSWNRKGGQPYQKVRFQHFSDCLFLLIDVRG